MTKVKICGITNLDDALHACGCGADALGFVFYDEEPALHRAGDGRGRSLPRSPPSSPVVGLFVNEAPGRVAEVADFCGLGVVQLHGDEGPQECDFAPYGGWSRRCG